MAALFSLLKHQKTENFSDILNSNSNKKLETSKMLDKKLGRGVRIISQKWSFQMEFVKRQFWKYGIFQQKSD